MNPGEYEIMSRVEQTHWWYRGLRDSIASALARPDLALPATPRVLDAGCGTGENLRMLQRTLDPGYLGGFDHAAEALEFARTKAPGADLYRSDICDPELHVDSLDLLVSLDVIYIPGVERSMAGLRRLVGALRPGGLFVLNLPAYNWLYSEHDVAIHTSQRFVAGEVRALLEELGLDVALLSYRLCLLFPMVVLSRLPGMFRARPGDCTTRSDLHAGRGTALGKFLYAILRLENRLLTGGLYLPWGSSVFAVGRER